MSRKTSTAPLSQPSARRRQIVPRYGHSLTIHTPLTLDDEIQATLLRAVAAASPSQRLTLLTLLETPDLLTATETMVSALRGGAR